MLTEKQVLCISLMISESKTQKQIAKAINISEKTICEWKKNEEFIAELHKQTREYLGILAIKATKEMEKLLQSKTEYIRLQTAKDILHRAGYKTTNKQVNGGNSSYEEFIKKTKGGEF